ncbi:MAG TPA: SDR family NAD(P)-dependent oxidoreductase [Thermoplasmata archaeon]|nr:SDR family NAD(P)-dependent oxidoreductase [Thermoplasmata archaeon]
MGRFEGRVVLVTGGSSGIGYATARAFLDEGAKVAISGRNATRLERAEKELAKFGTVLAIRGDVGRAADAKRMVSETAKKLGPLDVLVNNAGIYLSKPVEAISEREYDELMDVNMKGTFLCTKFALPGMVRRKRGAIVNVASDSGLVGAAGSSVYCASKGAMVLFTKAVALDHAKDGVRVNVVCPGEVRTPMMEKDAAESGRGFEEYYRRLVAPIPMKRAATSEEIAGSILFLASDAASFMTGTALSVDGGSTAL